VFITGKEDGAYFHAQTRSNGTGNIIIIIYGDVDLDGEVSYNDATLVSQYVNNTVQLSTQQMVLADVNGDGYVDNDDATLIVSYVNGNINQFPVEY
ncbi:MAG: dockerin type I repeat-containing protein, partial [Oscillospiraceae bacterium]|nr:dockerin type I repeat-containing protein [Oscillospiraceae bacterium]